MAGEELYILFIQIAGHTVGSAHQIGEATALRLFEPRLVIAVAVENDAFMAAYCIPDKVMEGRFKVFRLLQYVGILAQGFSHGSIEHYVCS